MVHRLTVWILAGVVSMAAIGSALERSCAIPEFLGSKLMSARHACCPPAECDCKVKTPREQAPPVEIETIRVRVLKEFLTNPEGSLRARELIFSPNLHARPPWLLVEPRGGGVPLPILLSNLRF